MPPLPPRLAGNLKAPRYLHLKGPVSADLPATARVISDEAERRQVLPAIAKIWKRKDLDNMVDTSPLIEVTFDGATAN